MANTFKAYSKASVGTTPTTAYQVELGAATGKTAIVIGISLANRAATPINVDVQIDRPAAGTTAAPRDDVYLAKAIPIPSGSTLEVMAGQKLILEYNGTVAAGDKIVVTSDTASSLDVIVNALEITS
jgi:hypothetical protein